MVGHKVSNKVSTTRCMSAVEVDRTLFFSNELADEFLSSLPIDG
jgi:hypothetical protein